MPIEPVQDDPNPEVVELLEYALEEARQGRLRAIVVVGARNLTTTFSGWRGMEGMVMPILAELETTKLDMMLGHVELRSMKTEEG